MDAAERKEILNRYQDHSRRFEEVSARRGNSDGAEVIQFQGPLRELEQEPVSLLRRCEETAHLPTLLERLGIEGFGPERSMYEALLLGTSRTLPRRLPEAARVWTRAMSDSG